MTKIMPFPAMISLLVRTEHCAFSSCLIKLCFKSWHKILTNICETDRCAPRWWKASKARVEWSVTFRRPVSAVSVDLIRSLKMELKSVFSPWMSTMDQGNTQCYWSGNTKTGLDRGSINSIKFRILVRDMYKMHQMYIFNQLITTTTTTTTTTSPS